MATIMQSILSTAFSAPATFATDSVRRQAGRLGRWVKAHSPLKFLNTPINRAIVAGNYGRTTEQQEIGNKAQDSSSASADSGLRAKVIKVRQVDYLKTDTVHVRRARTQIMTDSLIRPLLKICLPDGGAPVSAE
ncbi:MAG: hypothetical protein OXC07_11235 [Kistimonas sp.]|nr:hypothetical protein [Kistimonas sp.]